MIIIIVLYNYEGIINLIEKNFKIVRFLKIREYLTSTSRNILKPVAREQLLHAL